MHPSFTRQFVTEGLGEGEFFRHVGRRTVSFWTEETVDCFLDSSRTGAHVSRWENEHLPWIRYAEQVAITVDSSLVLNRQVLEFRQATRQIRKNRWFPIWYSNEIRHQLSNYDAILQGVPEDSVQFIRPTLHSRIARVAEALIPPVDAVVTVFKESGQDPDWMFADMSAGLAEFTSWRASAQSV